MPALSTRKDVRKSADCFQGAFRNKKQLLRVMTDQQLIEGLKNKNEQAFRLLVSRYQEMVISTCFHFLQDTDDAHDVAQEVFIEVFKSISRFRQDAAIATWLYRIAVNKSLNYLRSKKSRQPFLSVERLFGSQVSDKNFAEPDFTTPLEKEAEYTLRAKMLHKAIEALPTNQKTAFTLHKFNHLPYAEIAEIMEVSLSAVESLIHRAKKNLQAQLIKAIKKHRI